MKRLIFLLIIISSTFCQSLADINVPNGFKIEYFAKEVDGARSMAQSPSGVLFVGTRSNKVYAILDKNFDHKADEVITIADGLNMPNGVAFKDGALYVAEVNRILRFENIEANLDKKNNFTVVYDKFPSDRHHGWKFIRIGPDNKLYVPVGAPCNVCDEDKDTYAGIYRLNLDGSEKESFAYGIRNTVGFDWHPSTKDLWFTDNGRDNMGDDIPSDELNVATRKGQHFGFPYIHSGRHKDPRFGDDADPNVDYQAPKFEFGAHVASLGMRFYLGDMLPSSYKNQIFVAEHGSWNRSSKVGYRVVVIHLSGNSVKKEEVFASGWLKDGQVSGRPVDVEELPDGSLLISDDYADCIYRVTYNKTN